jgi:hypothetical protein
MGDQLDTMIKAFSKLNDDGIDVGVEMRDLVAQHRLIKEQYKKKG